MRTVLFGLAASLLATSPAFADVHLTLQDGRVSIVAKDATVRQILAEWARVGQTKIVNVERIPGGPETFELNNVTEMQALDVLLRALSGYIAAPRTVGGPNLSTFDRIIIMPTLAAARPAVSASSSPPPVSQPPPAVSQPAPQFQQPVEDVQGDVPTTPTVPPQTPVRYPSAPFAGVAVPGMIVQPPRQPDQALPGGFVVPPQTHGLETAQQPVRRRGDGKECSRVSSSRWFAFNNDLVKGIADFLR